MNKTNELSERSQKELEEYKIEILFEYKYNVRSLKKAKMDKEKELLQSTGM